MMKHISKHLWLILLIVASFTLGTGVLAQEAQPVNEEVQAEESLSLAACHAPIRAAIEAEQEAFLTFIDQHFQNELENSVLVERAFERYRHIERNLKEELNKFTKSDANILEIGASEEACRGLIAQAGRDMQSILRQHVINTAYGKSGLKITDKYKAINKKLRDFNLDMSRMRANFYSFNNKLPSFTQVCGK